MPSFLRVLSASEVKRGSRALAAILLLSLFSAALPSRATAAATNPILFADVPDISMIRVGNVYYAASTTMHLAPGVPILRSDDLVNWSIVNYAHGRLGENDLLNLENGRSAYGHGSWAPSLRHHNGVFYVTTFASTTGRTHIFTTRDLEHGPWSSSSFAPALHDSSLFFDDDGRVYMIYGHGRLSLIELSSDLSGPKPNGQHKVLIENPSVVAGGEVGLPAEGSQLFKINGWYYLFNITWPKGGMRTVLVHRSRTIDGVYEGRVALQDRGIAQGGLVNTPEGKWYAYLFRDFGAVGRIPYLVPVSWQDDWPVFGENGRAPDVLPELPASRGLLPGLVASDDFQRSPNEPALPLVWQWNHNPVDADWSLSARPGFLRLTTSRVDRTLESTRNILTQRTVGPACTGEVALDTAGLKEGDLAGLVLLQRQFGLIGVTVEGGHRFLVVRSGEKDGAREQVRLPLASSTVYLRAECLFADRADRAQFSYRVDGQPWTSVGEPLAMAYTIPHFMGYRFGLFLQAQAEVGGVADFDYFHVTPGSAQERP